MEVDNHFLECQKEAGRISEGELKNKIGKIVRETFLERREGDKVGSVW